MNASASHPHKTPLVLLFILGSVTAMTPFSMDMYLPALPEIGRQMHASTADTELTVAVFFLGTGLGQLIFGPISDRFGRRWPALAGMVLYVAASLGCVVAGGIGALIALRLAQAIGVCSGQVVARAMLADLFEPQELARFSSLLTMITLVAPIIAPLMGGFLFSHFGWRIIFIVLAAYGVMVLSVVALRLPETRTAEAKAKSRLESPIAGYKAILANGPLMRMAFLSAASACGLYVYLASAPHLIIERFGVPAAHFGFYFAANSVGLFAGSNLNRILLRKHTPSEILAVTSWVYLGAALLLTAGAMWPFAGKWTVLVPLFFIIAVFPMVTINSTAAAQGMDRHRGGAVAAVLGSLQGVVGALAIALSGQLGDGSPLSLGLAVTAAAAVSAGLFFIGRPGRAAS